MTELVLASASPRRVELLRQMGLSFEQLVVDLDEQQLPGELPEDYVMRMAREKSAMARQRLEEDLSDTAVKFVSLSREQCEAYLATDEPWDKAGAYGIQGLAGAFVESVTGSYSGVVGLPLAQTWQLLQRVGIVGPLARDTDE